MIKKSTLVAIATPIAMFIGGTATAAVSVGQPAPSFSLKDVNGKAISLADYKGKHVVLEWHNPACPFVVKHYDTNNMQALQNKYDAKETVWLSINSTNPKHQDFMSNDKLAKYIADKKVASDAYLVDSDGKVGQMYGAKTTPHMFIIDPQGKLIYNGAIDDKRSAKTEDVKGAKNFVVAALDEAKSGKPVSAASNAPYGCSVKYQ
jgi:peroxiredoxin